MITVFKFNLPIILSTTNTTMVICDIIFFDSVKLGLSNVYFVNLTTSSNEFYTFKNMYKSLPEFCLF